MSNDQCTYRISSLFEVMSMCNVRSLLPIEMSTLLRTVKRLLFFVFALVCSVALFNYSSQSFFSMPSDYAFWKRSGSIVTVSNVCTRNYSNATILNIDVDAEYNMTDLERNFETIGGGLGGAYSPKSCHSRQRIAILVPYRNRSEHLTRFLAHMHPFLQKQNTSYRIFVIEQADSNPFSRGLLLNIGAKFATGAALKGVDASVRHDYDCLIFHDVDVLPENELNVYFCDERSIRHIASAIDEMRYHAMYYNQASTVVSVTAENFKLLNGFSNLYWGWGQEDDDFTSRALDVGLKISRPPYHIGRFKMLRHIKSWRDDTVSFTLFMAWKARYRQEGANSLDRDINYKVLAVENAPLYTNITVDLGVAPAELIRQASKLPQMSLFTFLSFYFP